MRALAIGLFVCFFAQSAQSQSIQKPLDLFKSVPHYSISLQNGLDGYQKVHASGPDQLLTYRVWSPELHFGRQTYLNNDWYSTTRIGVAQSGVIEDFRRVDSIGDPSDFLIYFWEIKYLMSIELEQRIGKAWFNKNRYQYLEFGLGFHQMVTDNVDFRSRDYIYERKRTGLGSRLSFEYGIGNITTNGSVLSAGLYAKKILGASNFAKYEILKTGEKGYFTGNQNVIGLSLKFQFNSFKKYSNFPAFQRQFIERSSAWNEREIAMKPVQKGDLEVLVSHAASPFVYNVDLVDQQVNGGDWAQGTLNLFGLRYFTQKNLGLEAAFLYAQNELKIKFLEPMWRRRQFGFRVGATKVLRKGEVEKIRLKTGLDVFFHQDFLPINYYEIELNDDGDTLMFINSSFERTSGIGLRPYLGFEKNLKITTNVSAQFGYVYGFGLTRFYQEVVEWKGFGHVTPVEKEVNVSRGSGHQFSIGLTYRIPNAMNQKTR